MIILAIDTASQNCAVALLKNGQVMAKIEENIGKGHAEKLMGQISDICEAADIALDDVDKLAVNTGPGSFTGIRVGVATARALALALNIEAVGVSAFEALAFEIFNKYALDTITIIMDAGRDLLYRQDFSKIAGAISKAKVQSFEEFSISFDWESYLVGPYAKQFVEKYNLQIKNIMQYDVANVVSFAKIATTKPAGGRPKPLYLRDADAKPQNNFALSRK